MDQPAPPPDQPSPASADAPTAAASTLAGKTAVSTPAPTVTSPFKRRVAITMLLFGAVCSGVGQTIVFAVLPPLARELGLSNFQVGLIFMLSASLWVICGPRWGRFSDQRGRKPFILIGMFGFALSMTLFGGAIVLGLVGVLSGLPLFMLLIFTRCIYGVIGSAGPPAAQAYIADRTDRANRTAGIASFSAAFGIGAMLGPSFGAATSLIAPTAPFFAAAALSLIMMLAVYLFLPERTGPTVRAPRAKLKMTDSRIAPFLLFSLSFGFINAAPIQTVAFYFIDRLGYALDEATIYVSIGLTVAAVSSLFSQLVLVQRFRLTPARLMRTAPILMILGHGLIFISDTLPPALIGMMASGLGTGLAVPGAAAAVSLSVRPDEQGGAIALSGAASATGFILCPPISFSLYAIAPQAPYLMTALCASGLLFYAWKSKAVGNVIPTNDDGTPPGAMSEPASSPYQ